MTNPAEFVTQVKREFQRVTWPEMSEVLWMSSAVVVFMVIFMIYFFASDSVVYYFIKKVLGV